MKRIAIIMVILLLSGCGQSHLALEDKIEKNDLNSNHNAEKSGEHQADNNNERILPGLPLSWINYKGEKYIFNKVYMRDQLNMEQIVPTETFTDSDDGTKIGLLIYIDKENGSIFIKDDSGPSIEWVQYTNFDK